MTTFTTQTASSSIRTCSEPSRYWFPRLHCYRPTNQRTVRTMTTTTTTTTTTMITATSRRLRRLRQGQGQACMCRWQSNGQPNERSYERKILDLDTENAARKKIVDDVNRQTAISVLSYSDGQKEVQARHANFCTFAWNLKCKIIYYGVRIIYYEETYERY